MFTLEVSTMEIGDMVYLNDNGMKTIGGITSMEMFRQSRDMVITEVADFESLCADCECYAIEVDQPLINQFMITTKDVEHHGSNKSRQ